MHDDPRPEAADPGDLTQRHPVSPTDPSAPATPVAPPASTSGTPTGEDDSPWARPMTPDPDAEPVNSFTPTSEPRSDWARSLDANPPVTPERWYEPAYEAAPAPVPAATAAAPRRGRNGSIVITAVLAAILASGGTVAALGAAGVLDRPAPSAAVLTPQATNTGATQPVTIDEQSATIAVAAAVSPAVVKITVTGSDNGNTGVIPATGVGSGVIYNSNGWILTNHHVVEGGDKFDVELKDGRVLSGKVYGIDTLTDLAIVKVDATGLPTAQIGESDSLKVGQLVVAIGSPLGTYSNSVTSGIVSAKGRSIVTDGNDSLTNLIQTDAAINPGNSGGPLLDASGSIVGINTAIASNSNGIGFAIPIDIARPIMEQAVAGKPLSRPYMGISFQSIDRKLADDKKLPVQAGALVGGTDQNGQPEPGVKAGTPADQAGIKDGDIITAINGKAIDEEHPLDATLAQFSPGETVAVDVLRNGTHVTLQVTLGTRPAGL
jgi:2-alkenal reductase